MPTHLRVARPVKNLTRTVQMYQQGLGLSMIGHFENHNGFDGAMVGNEGADYHFEFTVCHTHPVSPAPTAEDLLVFYLPNQQEWEQRCSAMVGAGFVEVESFNPYWNVKGRTFQDPDGYRIVIQCAAWTNRQVADSNTRPGS